MHYKGGVDGHLIFKNLILLLREKIDLDTIKVGRSSFWIRRQQAILQTGQSQDLGELARDQSREASGEA
jgi:hypothetical protein